MMHQESKRSKDGAGGGYICGGNGCDDGGGCRGDNGAAAGSNGSDGSSGTGDGVDVAAVMKVCGDGSNNSGEEGGGDEILKIVVGKVRQFVKVAVMVKEVVVQQ